MELLLFWTLLIGLVPLPARSEVKRTFEVAESASSGTRLGFLSDRNGKDTLGSKQNRGFIMVYPPESQVEEHFAVDEFSGEIRTRSSLDYENRSRYVFLAIRTDGSGGIRVTIEVVDENDNAPTFPVVSIDIQLSEYAKLNAETPLPSATDLDSGIFGVQQYKILSGNINNAFRLSTRQLNNVLYVDLIVNGQLDREFRERYMLDIQAVDGGSPPLVARLQANVTIIDGNDNSPEFTQPRYLAQLFENSTVGSSVIKVQATDKDIGPNSRIEYRLLPSPSQAHRRFAIDPSTGLITVAQPVMHDQRKTYEILVVARDGGLQPLESTAFVTVTVLDAGQLLPKMTIIFMGAGGQPTVSEDAQPGDIIARVSVGDPDTGEDYQQAVNMSLSGDHQRHFGIESSGTAVYILQLARPVDREVQDHYILTFSALDSKNRLARKNVTLKVLDANDNIPLFMKPVYEAEVREKSGIGTSVLQVTAMDADIGPNAEIQYSFKKSAQLPYTNWFDIDSETGLIITAQPVDCEVSAKPELVVVARDKGNPPRSSESRIIISVLDINDNPPVFKQAVFNATLPEDSQTGSCFLQLSAIDPDCGVNAQVHYSIPEAAPERRMFSIDPMAGTICLQSALDFEKVAAYQFSVVAHDGGGLSSSTLVQIFVTDIDDNSPIFYPQVYNVSVREQARPGLPLLIVSATDLDSGQYGTVSYSIIPTSQHASLFRVDEKRGELHIVRALSPNVYNIQMQATDGGGLASQQMASVTVNVLSQDQPSPSFDQKLYKFTVREDVLPGIAIGKVRALGPTGLPISYAIYSGDPNGRFLINSLSGTITVHEYLDADTEPSLLLNIQAALGSPPSFNHTQVQIMVEDINDNSPVFESTHQETHVSEDHSPDVPFFVVQALDNDRDEQRNGKVTYRLLSTEPRNGPFFVRPVSGELMLTHELDFESVNEYRIMISAQDDGIPSRSSNMSIIVHIVDTNDHIPEFKQSSYSGEVSEAASILARLIQVQAIDRDAGQNGHIVYSLSPSPRDGKFGVLADSGWIYVRKALDRETKSVYTLTVRAEDNGTPKLSSTVDVHLKILDVNDNAPNCSSVNLSIEENQPSGTFIGRVEASDPDLGQNGTVFYSIEDESKMFRMDAAGELYTMKSLDAESQSELRVSVVAQDNGVPALISRCLVTVKILDTNDNSPFFILPHRNKILMREELPAGSEVVQVRANDPDSGINGSVTYRMVEGERDLFEIDSRTGLVTLKQSLDFERVNSPIFRLKIMAEDGGRPPKSNIKEILVELVDVPDGQKSEFSRRQELGASTDELSGFEISESALPGTKIGALDSARAKIMQNVNGDGVDEKEFTDSNLLDISYEIVKGNSQGLFEIDRVSSVLYLVKPLDYETSSVHILEINRVDVSRPALPVSSLKEMRINVLDENDNAPVFPDDPVIFSVPENGRLGQVVWRFNASDLDSGANGRIQYAMIEQSPESAVFDMDSVTGELWLQASLDYERCQEYLLVVEASDQALNPNKRRTSRVTTWVYVTDINDNAPEFRSVARIDVFEDEPAGYPLMHIVAVDQDWADNSRISYTITAGNELKYFDLNETSGSLTLSKRLDRTSPRQLSLHIVATDHGSPPQATPQILGVSVQSVHLDTPRFSQSLYKTNVSENLNPGATVVKLQADQNEQLGGTKSRLVFELANSGDSGSFDLDKFTGLLKTVVVLDRERKDTYMLTVYVRDSEHPSKYDAGIVIVDVIDVNDFDPELAEASCLPISVPENQKFENLHTVYALDKDSGLNGKVSYSISGGNTDSKFAMDFTSGQISCEPLDREIISQYELTILATDNGIPAKAVSCQLLVRVLDENDQPPRFDLPAYSANIEENQPPGTILIRVSATDLDEGANGEVTYALMNNSAGLFEIHPQKGIITTVRSLDFESLTAYTLRVRASDRGISDPLFTEAQVTIRVVDVNDHAPSFTHVPYIVNVTTEVPAGQRIARVTASDQDGRGSNSEVFYSLSTASDDFTINPTTGVISARREMRLQPGLVYYLSVSATDNGKPIQKSEGIVEVRVKQGLSSGGIGEEDSITFPKESYRSSIDENAPELTEIVTLKAFRRLTGQTDGIQYSIVSGNVGEAFAVDQSSGLVYVSNSKSVDYETTPVFRLVIEASSVLIRSQPGFNGGASPDHAYVSVLVDVMDMNDHKPQFLQQRYSTAVWEGKPRGTYVIQVSAVDDDVGENAYISYSIVSGNLDSAFSVDDKGLVNTNAQLDREIQDIYSLTVMATDSGVPPGSGTTIVEIQVIDVNDNSPSFPPLKTLKVHENTPIGSLISVITANDVDANPVLEYGLLRGGEYFQINRFSGRLTVADHLDFEKQSEIELLVEVNDGVHSVQAKVKVEIEDVNDNSPEFDQAYYQVALPEDTPIGASIVQTKAVDLDSGENSRLSYELVHDPNQNFASPGFWIDTKNGAIHTNQTLSKSDRSDKLVQLSVKAIDHGFPPRSTFTTVQIQIVSRTQNKQPKFTQDFYRFTVPESSAAHSILGILGVVLPPGHVSNGGLKFRILAGDDSRSFSIDDQGRIILDRLLDRETTEQYSLQVSVHTKSNSVANSTATVVIEVEDVNDNSPKFAESQISSSVGEASKIGTVVTRLSASDVDSGVNGQIQYEITSGVEDGLFELDAMSGVLKTVSKLSSAHNPVRLVIRASDHGKPPRSTITTLTIGILDENDNGPFFPLQLYLSRVAENAAKGTLVFSAKASDTDNGDFGKILYSLEDRKNAPQRKGDALKFAINEMTGEVRSDAFFDYESRTSYHFTIVATDNGGRQSRVPGQVLIRGVDEFAPSFLQKSYMFQVNYNAEVDDVVGVVYAVDQDFGADGEIRYYFKEPNDYLKINNVTGVISIKLSPVILGQSISSRVKRAVTDVAGGEMTQLKDSEPLVKTMFMTVIARSGAADSPNPKQNTTSVEIQLGNFIVGSSANIFDPKTITIISIVLVLIVIVILLFLALKLRRKKEDKRPDSRVKRLVLPGKRASKLSNCGNASVSGALGTGSTAVPLMRRLSSTSMCSTQLAQTNNGSHHRVRSSPSGNENRVNNTPMYHQQSPLWMGNMNKGGHYAAGKGLPLPVPSPMPPPLSANGVHSNPIVSTNGARRPLNSVSNLSGKSSGRGSVDHSDADEEIRQLTSRATSSRSHQGGRSMPDSGINMLADDSMSVASDLPSAQEYLTSLGITTDVMSTGRTAYHDINKVVAHGRVEAVELLDATSGLDADGVDVQELIYSKVSEVLAEDGEVAGTSRPLGDLQWPGHGFGSILHRQQPSFNGSQGFPLAPSAKTAPPPNWGPAYQPLTQVFSEISKLKHEQDTLSRGKRGKHGQQSSFPTSIGPGRPATPTRLPLNPHAQNLHFQSPSLPMSSGGISPGVWVPRYSSPSSPPPGGMYAPPDYPAPPPISSGSGTGHYAHGLYATGEIAVTLPGSASQMSESEVEIKI